MPPPDNTGDWSQGHILINWPVFALNIGLLLLIGGVGVAVWIIMRKRK